MAQGRRVERVAALIRKEVSELLINGIRDERVHQGMVSWFLGPWVARYKHTFTCRVVFGLCGRNLMFVHQAVPPRLACSSIGPTQPSALASDACQDRARSTVSAR